MRCDVLIGYWRPAGAYGGAGVGGRLVEGEEKGMVSGCFHLCPERGDPRHNRR